MTWRDGRNAAGMAAKAGGAARSMGHEDRKVGVGENMPGGAAKDHLSESALRVGTFDEQIATECLGVGEDGLARRPPSR